VHLANSEQCASFQDQEDAEEDGQQAVVQYLDIDGG
jgi:hypothetical protein